MIAINRINNTSYENFRKNLQNDFNKAFFYLKRQERLFSLSTKG